MRVRPMGRKKGAPTDPEIEKAVSLLEGRGPVLVLGHQFPDGDAIGSVLGLGLMLRAAGRQVAGSWPEPFDMPEKYSFLPGSELLARPTEISIEPELVVAVDCANAGRLEELQGLLDDRPLINVDHHADNTRFGTANIVDEQASAATAILFLLAREAGLPIDLGAATCLYTGIVTDTGRFQFSNTTAKTFAIAAEMVGMGVEPHLVYQNVYQSDSLSYIRLTGEVACKAVYDCDLGLIYGFLSQEDLASFDVKMNETEDLIDNLRTLRGHGIAALFKELSDGSIRVSLRSKPSIDIGSLARRLGGGGHRVAAGYTSTKSGFVEALAELKGEIIAARRSADSR